MEFTLDQIAGLVNGEIVGDKEEKIKSTSKIQEAKKGSVTFLANPKYEKHIYETEASAVFVARDFSPKKKIGTNLIRVDDPYSSFTVLLEEYHKSMTRSKTGIEEPSFIGQNTVVGEGIYRGAFSYIGHNVTLGDNVKVYPQVYIGDDVVIGNDCTLYSGVKVYHGTHIGNRCVIHSGAVIGSDGFGFAPQKDGTYKTIPQMGNVVIEDNVDIGANTVIDRATIGSTVIAKGVKLDNLIQIAHNVKIGENTVMAAQSGVSGSTTLGKNCVVGGQAGIVGHLEIADRVSLAAKTGLSKSVKKPGTIKFGSPALDYKEFLRCNAVFRNLPDLRDRVKLLEEKILNLRPQ